jgi:hypothetical protein
VAEREVLVEAAVIIIRQRDEQPPPVQVPVQIP